MRRLQSVITEMMYWFKVNNLKANPDKFQLIMFDRTQDMSSVYLNIDCIQIKSQSLVKLLCVYIDDMLSFTSHISNLCKKAGFKTNALARLSAKLDFTSKMMLFNSFVLSHFLYCPVVWHMCNLGDIQKMEKIQKRALQCILNDHKSSYRNLLSRCNQTALYIQRQRLLLIEMFKIINCISPTYLHDIFVLKESSYDMRNIQALGLPRCNTNRYGINSFK